MAGKTLTMEVDYNDIGWEGFGKKDVIRLFEECERAGIRRMFWSAGMPGYAEYHSKIQRWFGGQERRIYSKRSAELVAEFDALELATRMGRKYGIDILPYFRMFDFGWPGLDDRALDKIDHGWWESRCGNFRLRGFPCYNMKEVRDRYLPIIKELLSYDVAGIMFMIGRNHTPYINPYRQPFMFGYNPAIAEEYKKRYAVDIREFEYLESIETDVLGPPAWTSGIRYIGAKDFDVVKWRLVQGEGAVQFIREARCLMKAGSQVALEFNGHCIPQLPFGAEPVPAKVLLDPVQLAADGLMDEWIISYNYHAAKYEPIESMRQVRAEVASHGAATNMWMNDLLTSDGGSGSSGCLANIEQYLQRFLKSDISAATLHEAAFLMKHPQQEEIWKLIGRYFSR